MDPCSFINNQILIINKTFYAANTQLFTESWKFQKLNYNLRSHIQSFFIFVLHE